MRRSIARALVLSALFAGAPAAVFAQDPEPAPAPAPPPPPRDTAVPRADRARETARPAPQAQAERARRPDTAGEPSSQTGGAVRREPRPEAVREAPARENRTGEEGSRRRERLAAEPPPATAASAPVANDEQNRRPGSVRRPPSDGGRPSGGGGGGGGSVSPRDRAVVRTGPPPNRDRDRDYDHVYVYPDYWSYGRYYDPYYSAFYMGYPFYSPWGWTPAFYGYPSAGYAYQAQGYDIGRLRIKVKPRDAEVFVDGYFAGAVDDFDGTFQSLKLDSGGYRIEIRKPGFETLTFDVRVQPDRTITYRGDMRPSP